MKKYIEDQHFEKIDFSTQTLEIAKYENCSFIQCDFSKADLSEIHFYDCEFRDCNLSMVKVVDTAFREVKFNTCKLLGLQFDTCNAFQFALYAENSTLDFCSFAGLKLKKQKFLNSSMREVDFSEADLSAAIFDNCDLADATFENCNLQKADFSTAFHFRIDPEQNQLKKAKFSKEGLAGLLEKYQIEVV